MPVKPAFSLTISPAKGSAVIGQSQTTTIYNTGSKPLNVYMHAQEITRVNGKCVLLPQQVPWAHLYPASMRIIPGDHVPVRLTIVRGAKPGAHDLVALASAQPSGGPGQVIVVGQVGAQYLLRVPGKATTHTAPCVHLAAPQHASGGFPVVDVSVLALVAVLLILATIGLVRRRHHAPVC
jgi:hypothetical protein